MVSASSIVHTVTRVVLSGGLLFGGVMLLRDYLGLGAAPDFMLYADGGNPAALNKWEFASTVLPLTSQQVKLFIGSCKFSAGVAMWTDHIFGMKTLATFMTSLLYLSVAWAHYRMPDPNEIVPALALSGMCLVNMATAPSTSTEKTRRD